MSESIYEFTADELVSRILKLIPTHPEILTMTEASDLLKIEGFMCDDIEPSYAQAQWSLGRAKQLYQSRDG